MSYKYAEEFFMFLIMREYDHQQQQHKHSRYRKDYYKKLDAVRRRLRSRRIPRVALHDPPNSAWNRLYMSGNDQGLITLTGMDFPTFRWLKRIFTPFIIKLSQTIDPEHNDIQEYQRLLRINSEATSMRQAAEWGMRALKSSFP